ncbi:MAG: dipeptide epimerase [Bacteroidetes bacterium]|nr:dipeptide epimerase [Bacteroidota bacterium]
MRHVSVHEERWRLDRPFAISRGARTHAEAIVVEITEGTIVGRGEAIPYAHYGESLEAVGAQIRTVIPALEQGMSRQELARQLPPGAARNAVDCALWDVELKAGTVHLPPAQPVTTALTLSLDTAEAMHAAAIAAADRPLIKIKLGGAGDLERLKAVREGAPRARLIVDANEAWTSDTLESYAHAAANVGVYMIEQPLPAGADEVLADLSLPVPIGADESVHTRDGLASLRPKYDFINIKLDKTGGLTEALALRDAAQALGFRIMVGCMLGTSLAMAPALWVAQGAELVDLDGPLLLGMDRPHALHYGADGSVSPPVPALWG